MVYSVFCGFIFTSFVIIWGKNAQNAAFAIIIIWRFYKMHTFLVQLNVGMFNRMETKSSQQSLQFNVRISYSFGGVAHDDIRRHGTAFS